MLGNIGYINRETAKELNLPLPVIERVVTQYFKELSRRLNFSPCSKVKIPKIGHFNMMMSKAKSLCHYYIKRLRSLRKMEERNVSLENDYTLKLRALWCQLEEHRKEIVSRFIIWNNYLISTYGEKAQIKRNYNWYNWKFIEHVKNN